MGLYGQVTWPAYIQESLIVGVATGLLDIEERFHNTIFYAAFVIIRSLNRMSYVYW